MIRMDPTIEMSWPHGEAICAEIVLLSEEKNTDFCFLQVNYCNSPFLQVN